MLINPFSVASPLMPEDLYFSFNGNINNTGSLVGVTATASETLSYTSDGVELGGVTVKRITVDATALELGTQQWQFQADIKVSSVSGSGGCVFAKTDIARNNGFEIKINTNFSVNFTKYGDGGFVLVNTSADVITPDTSQVLKVYFDGSDLIIEVDGVNKLTSSRPTLNIVSVGNPYRIGAIDNGYALTGSIKNLSFNVT